eukprot:2650362-Rhodomonas_salina.2
MADVARLYAGLQGVPISRDCKRGDTFSHVLACAVQLVKAGEDACVHRSRCYGDGIARQHNRFNVCDVVGVPQPELPERVLAPAQHVPGGREKAGVHVGT